MDEIQILQLSAEQYTGNGMFTVAVIMGIFITFRAARFAAQNNIFAKVMTSLFGLMIGWFSIVVGSLRPVIDAATAVRFAEAQAAGATLTAQAQDAIAQAGASAGDVVTQNYFGDIGTVAFTAIFLIIALGIIWGPKMDFSE